MIKRLFIKLPLYTIFFGCMCTGIIPVIYWILTGEDYFNLMNKIDHL